VYSYIPLFQGGARLEQMNLAEVSCWLQDLRALQSNAIEWHSSLVMKGLRREYAFVYEVGLGQDVFNLHK
jgi:hypothetical protein